MKTYNVIIERNEEYVFNVEAYNPSEAEEKALKSLYERDPKDSRTDISVIEITDSVSKPKEGN